MGKKVRVVWIAAVLTVMAMLGVCPGVEASTAATVVVEKSQQSLGEGTFFIPEVNGLKNPGLQKRVNDNLKVAILAMANPGEGVSLNGDFEISYDNGTLLGIHFVGYSMTPGAIHPNKIDQGIHVSLTNGSVYRLEDLFIPGVDYRRKIVELCKQKEQYRLQIPGLFDAWKHSDFEGSWSGAEAAFMLGTSSVRVYSIPRYVTGAISGYSVPYPDLMEIINQNGSLWKSLRRHVVDKRGIQAGDVVAGLKVVSVDRRAGSLVDATFDGAVELVGEMEWLENTGDGPGYIFTIDKAYADKLPVLNEAESLGVLKLKVQAENKQLPPKQKTKVKVIVDGYSVGERQLSRSAVLVKVVAVLPR